MLPLASASGYAVVLGAVVFAAVFVWWLLRMEARDTEAEQAEEEAAGRAERDPLSPP